MSAFDVEAAGARFGNGGRDFLGVFGPGRVGVEAGDGDARCSDAPALEGFADEHDDVEDVGFGDHGGDVAHHHVFADGDHAQAAGHAQEERVGRVHRRDRFWQAGEFERAAVDGGDDEAVDAAGFGPRDAARDPAGRGAAAGGAGFAEGVVAELDRAVVEDGDGGAGHGPSFRCIGDALERDVEAGGAGGVDDAVVVADEHDAAAALGFAGGEGFDRDFRADAGGVADGNR